MTTQSTTPQNQLVPIWETGCFGEKNAQKIHIMDHMS